MRKVRDWRSHHTALEFKSHDNADLAQEFLCRNVRYQDGLSDTDARIVTDPASSTAEQEGLARRWGLSFPLRFRPVADHKARPLVARARGQRRHHRRSAG